MSCEAICKASTGTLTGGVTKTVAANVKKTGTLSFVTVKNRGSLSTSNCFSKMLAEEQTILDRIENQSFSNQTNNLISPAIEMLRQLWR